MKMKPKSMATPSVAILYRRFTDVESSYNQNAIYLTEDGKYWLFSYSDMKRITRILKNGNFVNLTDWDAPIPSVTTISASQNQLTASISGFVSNRAVTGVLNEQDEYRTLNHIMFVSFEYRLRSDFSSADIIVYGKTYHEDMKCDNLWHRKSIICTRQPSVVDPYPFDFRPILADGYPQTITTDYSIRNVNMFDLTADFGSGKEPESVSECLEYYGTEYYKKISNFVEVKEEDIHFPANIISVESGETHLQYKNIYFVYENGEWRTADYDDEELLSAKYSNIAKYQTNRYYHAGSFNFMVKGSVDSSETQPIKGNIMNLTSFVIKYYDDDINIDHDDLVVVGKRLYSVSEPTFDMKMLPKPYKIYFATLNSIL